MYAELQFTLQLEWFDHQVKWVNLKQDTAKNVLLQSEVSKLWMPKLIFQNSDNILPIPFDDASVLAVIKKDNGISAIYPEELNRAIYFNGSTNPVSYSRKFQDKYAKLKNLFGNQ
jgi:hypothetical protein